jgi:hypothetical protein
LLQYGMVHRSGGNKQTELIITNHWLSKYFM